MWVCLSQGIVGTSNLSLNGFKFLHGRIVQYEEALARRTQPSFVLKFLMQSLRKDLSLRFVKKFIHSIQKIVLDINPTISSQNSLQLIRKD